MRLGVARLAALAALPALTASYNSNDQVGADIDYGSFQNPSSHVRPRFRYWIPDASVKPSDTAADFAKVKAVGMGGLELLGYYLYGDFPRTIAEGGPIPTDWTRHGWGTPAWKELQDAALRAAKEYGLIMDFALGPNQGAGVPARTNDGGIMWDLWPFNTSVPIGSSFNSTLPGWADITDGEFVGATIGLVTHREIANISASPAWEGPYYYNGANLTLAASSLRDVTDLADKATGHANIDFPTDVNGLEYQVFAYYQNHTNYHEQAPPWYVNASVPQSPVETFVENGSWVVDHFSATGAQLVIDFWEEYLLVNGTRELIQEVGNYGWEDSQEFGAGTLVWWTPDLLNAFATSRGYNLTTYLPLIYRYNSESPGPLASPNHYFTDEPDQGMSHINDYWQTLTELNQIYLRTLSNWTMESLKSQFSAQVVYNLPMDMLANVPHVNAPECESLDFNHLIDGFKQYSGPANLAGKRVVSSELGAMRNEVYSQTLPELIWDIKRSIVGGINNFILHGYPFSSNFPNTTWPGFTTFGYRFSNMHGPRQPSWEYYDDYMNWIARTQYVAQSGIPKVDLAFWLKQDQYFHVNEQYYPLDLEEAGFTYEYLSPDNFALPEAYVSNGILAPNRQAFKAFILRGNDSLTVSGVATLVEWANAGLPIIVSGGFPQNLTGYNASGGTEYVRSALAGIANFENVHVVPYDNLAASLTTLGFIPRTSVNAERIWNTAWREDVKASVSYIFLYNDAYDSEFGGGASKGSVTFDTTGVPYLYDAWTGNISPMVAYEKSNATTTIQFSLAGNQSLIIGFHHNETSTNGLRVTSLPDEVYNISLQQSRNGDQVMINYGNTSKPIQVSNGTSVALPSPATPVNLTDWSLTVESWSPPSDLYEDQTKAAVSNHTYSLTSLVAWNQISESLTNTSGRGFYSTTFSWPPQNGSADGAALTLGAIYNTARIWVNQQRLPPLDPTNAIADIGPYLMNGTNDVEIVVSTTLGNALRPIYKESRSSGTTWLGPQPVEQGYGLLLPVTVIPYNTITLEV